MPRQLPSAPLTMGALPVFASGHNAQDEPRHGRWQDVFLWKPRSQAGGSVPPPTAIPGLAPGAFVGQLSVSSGSCYRAARHLRKLPARAGGSATPPSVIPGLAPEVFVERLSVPSGKTPTEAPGASRGIGGTAERDPRARARGFRGAVVGAEREATYGSPRRKPGDLPHRLGPLTPSRGSRRRTARSRPARRRRAAWPSR